MSGPSGTTWICLRECLPPLAGRYLLARLGELLGRGGLECCGRSLDPWWYVLVPLGLVLPGLDQAFQLVSVLGEPRFQGLPRLVLVNQVLHRLADLGREAGHLVGRDLRVRRGDDVALADRGKVADAALLAVVEQAEEGGLTRVGALHERQ